MVEKKETPRFEITEVATQTAPVIKDTESEDIYNELTAICKIMNDVEKLKKGLTG